MLEESRRIAAASEALAVENKRLTDADNRLVEHTKGAKHAAMRQADRNDAEVAQREKDRRRASTAAFHLVSARSNYEGINLRLPNLGPHGAKNVSAAVTDDGQPVSDGSRHRQLVPKDYVRVAARSALLEQFIFGQNPNRLFSVTLNYTDGNGPQDEVWEIRFTCGLQLHEWRLEIEEAPDFCRL